MRRWMRSLVVALLCLTLCVDTAKACWWRRHRTFTRSGVSAVRYQPLDAPACCTPAPESAWFLFDDRGSTMPGTEVVESEMLMPTSIDSMPIHEQVEVTAEPAVVADASAMTLDLEHPGASPDTVVVHDPTFVVEPAPAAPAAAPEPAPVVTAPADDIPPQPLAPPMPAAPAPVDTATVTDEPTATLPALEPNLFDRYDEEAGSADEEAGSADEEAGSADEEPAAEEAAPEEPAAEVAPEAAFFVPDEPMRRWTNAAGTHHAHGWLVELHADRVRILKVNGRHTTMALESLSEDDRAYVSAVGGRLAAARQHTATAGL